MTGFYSDGIYPTVGLIVISLLQLIFLSVVMRTYYHLPAFLQKLCPSLHPSVGIPRRVDNRRSMRFRQANVRQLPGFANLA